MGSSTAVAVIGAGPYGLAVAAHLAGAGLRPRVFGRPMQTWREYMPNGMVLKSEGFAMNISDPRGAYTLGAHCAEHNIPYQDVGWPVPVEVFAGYGEAFASRFVPQAEAQDVVSVGRRDDTFRLTLGSGEIVSARNVVLATGLRAYARHAPVLMNLPPDRVTHSGDQGDMEPFLGKRVAVLGGGASAMDVAAALHRRGALATAITHRSEVRFFPPNGFRDRFLSPLTPLGPGWKKQLCVKAPDLFHLLPEKARQRLIAKYLGPAPAWSVREIIQAHTDLRLRTDVTTASFEDGEVKLTLDGPNGVEVLAVDHVIAATGYDIDIERQTMLEMPLRAALRRGGKALRLNPWFETRVPGLFVVGTPAASSFGPLLRFVCGTDFAARRTAGRILGRDYAARRESLKVASSRVMPLSEA